MNTGFGCCDGKRPSAHRRFQRQEVVGGADQAPFALHFPQSAQEELSKAPRLSTIMGIRVTLAIRVFRA